MMAKMVPQTGTIINDVEANLNDQKSKIESIRLKLVKKLKNSNKLAGVIVKLNKPEKSLTLTKRKFLKLIKQVIKHIYPKITPTKELLDAVWDQACDHPNDEMNQDDDVIEKDRLDQWLFSEM